MITLNEFLASDLRNSHVKHPEFRLLYVRKAHHMVDGAVVHTFDVANIVARREGRGTFGRLVAELLEIQAAPIYVECVMSPRFGRHLESMGFEAVGSDTIPSPSYVLKRSATAGSV